MSEIPEAIELLHTIVLAYESNVDSFYGKQKRNNKYMARFDFKIFARKIFDPLPSDKLGDIYIDLFSVSPEYMHRRKISRVGKREIESSLVTVPELIFNIILPYQLPYQTSSKMKDGHKEEDDGQHNKTGESAASTSSRKKRRSSGASGKIPTPRVKLTPEQSKSLLEMMVKIPLQKESNLWKQAKYILCPNGSPKLLAEFGQIIAKCIQNGMISFAALNFFMHDEVINRYMENPGTILHALYLGPLSSQTVEMFAANRSNIFRDQCREILRVAIEATRDIYSFQMKQPGNIPCHHTELVKYRFFMEHVHKLINDLKGEEEPTLHVGWACAALKKFGHKRYVEKTWRDENYYDLIWTVLAQRPNLKRFVCDLLDKYNDHQASKFWRRMQPQQIFKSYIRNSNVITEDPLKPTENFLNFPSLVTSINVITTDKMIQDLIKLLREKIAIGIPVLAGVDAEWSAYSRPSRATILQVALYDNVFIVDLESPHIRQSTYDHFLTFFFGDPKILKIGFQFGEDLHQLRSTFRTCTVLYEPQNVICVGRLITDLFAEMKKLKISKEKCHEVLPLLADEAVGDGDVSIDENEDVDVEVKDVDGPEQKKVTRQVEQQPFANKGLSFFCEKILGKPLDKTEQCSVWDRRPLRNLQLRYAAMDAYCMLLLYDKLKWAYAMIGADVDVSLSSQQPIRVSFPLLIECPL